MSRGPSPDDRLAGRILAALAAAGRAVDPPTPEDLQAVDEFHIRGRAATDALAQAAAIAAGDRVLDVGCGLGGPARRLAGTRGCPVLGIDLSPAYVAAAATLSERVGLGARVAFAAGDATALPVPAGAADVVWSQHAAMAIADKTAMATEWRRALRPGGRLALYEVTAGPGGPPRYPAPWSATADRSFLETADALGARLAAAGFRIVHRRDDTEAAAEWFARQAARLAERGPPPVGLHLVLGPAFAEMAANQDLNLRERRIGVVEIVARAV